VQPPTIEDETQLIDLRQFLSVVRRRKWTVIITALVVVSLAIAAVYVRQPTYTSVARVEVGPLTASSALTPGAIYDLMNGMETEAQRVTSQPVAAVAASTMGIPESETQELASSVTPCGDRNDLHRHQLH